MSVTKKRTVIEPLTRVEGHGKVTLWQDEQNQITQVRLHIVEFRGFEKFIQGRPYWELPVLVQRLCGICPVSHHLAAAKACDQLIGVTELPPTAIQLRRLMHFGQVLQSHALHFFHLASPDLLFGFEDAIRHRNIVGVINDHPELARRGVLLRKFGQEIIRLTSGRRVHGTGAVPGGVNRNLSVEDRASLLSQCGEIIDWAEQAVALIADIYRSELAYQRDFATIDTTMLSLIGAHGELELYDGKLRIRQADGSLLHDQYRVEAYPQLLREQVKSWSYMKFPYLAELGPERGWYRVGPLARLNNCHTITTPLAEAARVAFMAQRSGVLQQATLATHWARLIELLHCAESIAELLQDDLLSQHTLRTEVQQMQLEGFGVIEAPRGTLIHHYQIDEQGLVTRANLIVSTTHNNQAMNESIRQVANRYLQGQQLTEPLLNRIEVAIRAYDPCLSCATHALGKMPLLVELVNRDGEQVSSCYRGGG
ncbi:Ni/Fe hydrogenase subunit alpha [Ectothiorhodospiraceae bacterium BW-2]|nr:Ni/Fe hydrogenase subunit alpha [Ectothiorhodospiraceae bacterium BW-2]